jgi:hypothetical protein
MAGPEGLSRRRAVNMHALLATGVKADEAPEILGVVIINPEDGASWPRLARGLSLRGIMQIHLAHSERSIGRAAWGSTRATGGFVFARRAPWLHAYP